MASLSATTESDYDFVEKPSEDFFCPVTLEFLREPHQMLCCGNHLSPVAVTRLQGQPCPLCKEPNLNTVPDKFFKRKVNELKVRCPNKSLGCEWVGELGDLNRHLSRNSVEGECQFVTVACPYSCGDDLQRCQLKGHKVNNCSNRPFTCRYCNHNATYIKVTNEHWPICKQYPLECPNKCEKNAIKRQHLPKHLETCPLQMIECEFSYAGCKVECQRQHMQTHLDENVKVHLTKVSHTQQRKTEEQQRRIEEQQRKTAEQQRRIEEQQSINEQLQKQIVALMSALTRVALDVQKPLAPISVTSPDLVMTDFVKHKQAGDLWYSPPFYTHIGGYKMGLSVDASGQGSGRGTHVSVFVCLMRGEHDDQLKWPFRGDIMIQLLNQGRNVGYCEGTLHLNDSVNTGRVVGQESAASGWGYPQFIAHNKLNTKDKEYLKNDCLKFRVTKAVVKSV